MSTQEELMAALEDPTASDQMLVARVAPCDNEETPRAHDHTHTHTWRQKHTDASAHFSVDSRLVSTSIDYMSGIVDSCMCALMSPELDVCAHTVHKTLVALHCHTPLLSQSGFDFNPGQSGLQSTPCLVRRRAAMVETHR